MKRIAALLLAAALCLGVAGCAAGNVPDTGESGLAPGQSAAPVESAPIAQPVTVEEPEPETIWTIREGMTLFLLQSEYPIGVEKLTLVLDNSSELELDYGIHFSVQKYRDGGWQEEDFPEALFFADMLYTLPAKSVATMELNIGLLGRPLDEGLYRVVGERVWVGEDRQESPAWHVDFRVTADAQPEPDYAVYIPGQTIPAVNGCLVTDRLPVYFINTTGEDGYVLDIPHLERQNDAGEWEEVPWKEGIGFCGTPSTLSAAGRDWSEEISMLWGTLEDGRYQLSYEVGATFETEETAYGEFTLYTPEGGHGLPLAADAQTEG